MVEYSLRTGRPLKSCPKGYERNPETNRICKKCKSISVVRTKKTVPIQKTVAETTKKTWNEMIQAWKSGRKLPAVKGSVFWETSVAKDGGESYYHEKTKSAAMQLPMTLPADPITFKKYIKGKKSPTSFFSTGRPPTLLVVPPNTGKNFSHLGTFYCNSTKDEKRALWKKVAIELEKKLKKGEKVYVSTHGLGVSWLHIRLSSTPKYFHTSLKNS